MKTTWKIINEEKGKTKQDMDIQSLVADNKVMINQNEIANTLNSYFLSIAHSINSDNNKHMNSSTTIPLLTYQTLLEGLSLKSVGSMPPLTNLKKLLNH
jgi:hypothetical protein